MTALQNPEAIRHFQSLCDACQALADRYHGPSELRLYADGYLHALRRTAVLDPMGHARDLIETYLYPALATDATVFLGIGMISALRTTHKLDVIATQVAFFNR